MHVATRLNNLRYDLVETAKQSWKDAGCPGLEEYWLDTLGYYRDAVLAALKSLGYYPYPDEWYESEDNFRYITIEIRNTFYSISVPSRWYAGPPIYTHSESCIESEFFRSLIGDYYVQMFDFAETVDDPTSAAMAYIDYMVLILMEDYLNTIEPSVYDIDKNGYYAFLLFWSDTGEMLSHFDAEEWWCEHTLEEIEMMYADILNPAYTSYSNWKSKEELEEVA